MNIKLTFGKDTNEIKGSLIEPIEIRKRKEPKTWDKTRLKAAFDFSDMFASWNELNYMAGKNTARKKQVTYYSKFKEKFVKIIKYMNEKRITMREAFKIFKQELEGISITSFQLSINKARKELSK